LGGFKGFGKMERVGGIESYALVLICAWDWIPNISRNILDVNRPTIGKYTTSYLVEYRPTIVFDLHRTLKGSINQSINQSIRL